MEKRLIEVDFPLEEVSKESAREKSIRHGHISTFHIWWARRPLASSRATTFASLIPAPENDNELKKKLDFIAKLSKWENSLNKNLIEKARKEIRDFFGDRPPKVLDCFAGGGSIPLEALRLGCETYALELNPVANLILKATLEYPQKFGNENTDLDGLFNSDSNQLLIDIKKWGNYVLREANKEIGKFYPPDPDGSIPIGYIWARTVECENPLCGTHIPLMRQFWLVKKKKKKVALKIIVDKKNKEIFFRIARESEIDFDPSKGTTRRATVRCPICGAGMAGNTLRRLFKEGKTGKKMIVVVFRNPNKRGKTYRLAIEKDIENFRLAEKYLEIKREKLSIKWGFDPIPNEEMPITMPGGIHPPNYGIVMLSSLFNSRQMLVLITFLEKVRLVFGMMNKEGYEEEYSRAVVTYLALELDMLSAFTNTLARWENTSEAIKHLYSRQAIPMLWDYAEVNPFSQSSGSIEVGRKFRFKVIDHCSKTSNIPATVLQATATRLPFPNDYFDAVITDPPYYFNVTYADLSDFFYVWLKRSIGDLYPDLLSTPLTPKANEIIEGKFWDSVRYKHKGKEWFEKMLTQSFHEIHRVLRSDGIACIVFAHKSTEAWESVINALLNSGLYLTASWPIHTEMKERLMAKESAALASSVYMICRKRTEQRITYFSEIRSEIEDRIKEKLTQFWEQGIGGADFFVSAIGPAVEVFGKYSRVERLSGEEVTVQELLEYVRKIVSDFALERVLRRTDLGGIDTETRFYLIWRWTFGNARVSFDDGIKLSRPMGIELTDIWDRGELIKKEKQYVRVLGPKEREKDEKFLRKKSFTSMIDVLHRILISWDKGERQEINEILVDTGYLKNELFWQTTQALSEILPEGDKEKQLIQGFLYGRETYAKDEKREKTLNEFMEERKE